MSKTDQRYKCDSLNFLQQRLDELKKKKHHRSPLTIESAQDPWVVVEGRRVLNLCSNNYLGLASNPQLKAKATQAISDWGCSSSSSRLICGTLACHHSVERQLAAFKGAESALLFTSGYMANLGIISALVNRGDYVFSDELNHASIIDGCRLSRANISVFAHSDMDDLEKKIQKSCQEGQLKRKLIVVDGVFSMDGDLAPLPDLVQLAEKYDCILMVDEAHATGVLGPGGRGVVAHFGLEQQIPIMMGTLSKALGSMGGFVVGSKLLTEYLVNTSRSFIFSTALPPMVVMSAQVALELLESDPSIATKVQENAEYLRSGLNSLGFDTLNSQTQIIPVLIGDAGSTIEMSRLLLEEGILATPIRPPTVPEGTCRIRTTVMATHTRQDLDFALEAFARVRRNSVVD